MEHLCLLSLIQPDRRSKQPGEQIKGGRESWGREGVKGKNIWVLSFEVTGGAHGTVEL